MKLSKSKVRWLMVLTILIVLLFLVDDPVEIVWLIAAGLIMLTAWHLMFGSTNTIPTESRKDRRFRNPPWTS